MAKSISFKRNPRHQRFPLRFNRPKPYFPPIVLPEIDIEEILREEEEREAQRPNKHFTIRTKLPHGLTQFELAFLTTHNECRALHACPKLRRSAKLSEIAHDWARKIANGSERDVLPDEVDYGMNVFYTTGTVVYGSEAPEAWYKQLDKYNYSEPLANEIQNRHFTQMIWKSTKWLGCGHARLRGGKHQHLVVVGIYKPRGNPWDVNAVKAYKENVPILEKVREEIRAKNKAARAARRAKEQPRPSWWMHLSSEEEDDIE